MFFEAMAVDDNLRWCATLNDYVTIHKPASSSQSWVRHGPALIQVDNNTLSLGNDFADAAKRAAEYNNGERMHYEDDLSLLAADCFASDADETNDDEPGVDQPDVDQPDVDQPDVEQPDVDDPNVEVDGEVVYLRTQPADDVQYIKTVMSADDVQYLKTVRLRLRRAVRRRSAMILRSQLRPRRSKRLCHDV